MVRDGRNKHKHYVHRPTTVFGALSIGKVYAKINVIKSVLFTEKSYEYAINNLDLGYSTRLQRTVYKLCKK